MTTTNQNQLTSATITTPEIIEDPVHVLRTVSGSAVLATTVHGIRHSQDTTLGEYLAGVESRLTRIDVPTTWTELTGKPKVFPPADHKHPADDITDAPRLLSMPMLTVDGKMALGKPNSLRLTAGSYRLAPLDHFELTFTRSGESERGSVVTVPAPSEGDTVEYSHTPTGTDGDMVILTAVSVDKLGNRSLPSPAATVTLVNAYIAAPGLLAPANDGTLVVGADEPLEVVFISEPFRAVGLDDTHTASQYRVLSVDGDTLYDSGETADLASHTYALANVTEGAVLRCSARHRGVRFNWGDWGVESRVSVVGKKFVTVGEHGLYSSSVDGVDWTQMYFMVPGIDGLCSGVVFGNGIFVAVGHSGDISTSIDGYTWTPAEEPPPSATEWDNVIFSDGKFVAYSFHTISTSVDGQVWTPLINTDWNIMYLAYGNGIFVAVGEPDTGIFASTDNGITWSDYLEGFGFGEIFYLDGVFVTSTCNGIFYSTNGLTWSESYIAGYNLDMWDSIVLTEGAIYAFGMGMRSTTHDGINWSYAEEIHGSSFYGDLFCGNGIFFSSNGTRMCISTDYGLNWNAVDNGIQCFCGLTYSNGVFVGISGLDGRADYGALVNSSDGLSWTPLPASIPGMGECLGITYADGKFVVCGSSSGYVSTSPNGLTWITAVNVPGMSYDCNAITYGNGTLVACGGKIATSLDGLTWTAPVQVPEIYQWNGITYGDGTFVVCGQGGYVSTSLDGLTWTAPVQVPEIYQWYGITYGDGKFVVCGYHGNVSTSVDGITWTAAVQTPEIHQWNGITYADGTFVVCGRGGYVSTSADGLTWTPAVKVPGMSYDWNGITYGDGKFVVCGSSGYVSTSLDGLTWTAAKQIASVDLNAITSNF